MIQKHLAAALLAAVSSAALAQSDETRMPWQSKFWGHAGLSFGGARLDAACPPNTGCDDTDQALRVFGGGRFNNTFGAEVGLVQFGDFRRGGGETDARALDVTATAGIPFGTNWSVFAKLGFIYSRAKVSGTDPGLQTGTADGWGPRAGLGLEMGITPNWALRGDWDRYRLKMPGGHENIDTLMLGVKYSFR